TAMVRRRVASPSSSRRLVRPRLEQLERLVLLSAPAFTSASSTTFAVGAAGAFTVTANGAPAPALSETGVLPPGVAFTDNHNGTANLAGTPAPNTGGTYTLTLIAANGMTPNAAQMFTLTVNQAPTLTSAPAAAFSVGKPGSFTVTTGRSVPTPALGESGILP